MLNTFEQELTADKSLNSKHVPHYIRWIRDCYNYFRIPPFERLPQEQVKTYLYHLANCREPWQIKQAEQALHRYDYFLTREHPSAIAFEPEPEAWKELLVKTRDLLRVKQMALNTEKTYLGWLHQFQLFLGSRPPRQLAFEDLRRFLSHLLERSVPSRVCSAIPTCARP